jgi:hypothetical protein
MAKDTTDKSMALARQLVTLSNDIMTVMEKGIAIRDEKEGAGIDFATLDATLASSDLRHVTSTDLNNAITNFVAFDTWAKAGFHDDVWQACRK